MALTYSFSYLEPVYCSMSSSVAWNVRSVNQGKLEVVKEEMARVNIDILGLNEPGYNDSLLAVSPHSRKGETVLWHCFCKDANPIHEGSTFIS